MRVASPSVYPLAAGSEIGGEVHEVELLRRLPAHGVELALALPAGRGHAHDGVPAGWRIDTVRDVRRAPWPLAPAVFVPWLRRTPSDLLRGGSVRFAGPSLLLERRRTGRPVVLHHHHLEPRWARVELALLRAADAVVTVSERGGRALVAGGVAARRVHVVPNGVTAPPGRDPWPEAWPGGPGLRALFLGRLEARKGPDLALAAAAASGVRLVIAGDGPLRHALAGRGATLLGRVSEEDKWRLLDAADVVLLPSALEGFGLVAAEAQVRGVPVIARAGTGVEEVVVHGETGLLVDGEAGWAAALTAVADPLAREEMGRAAARRAARFSWDAATARLAAVYAEVASSRGRISSRSRSRIASGR